MNRISKIIAPLCLLTLLSASTASAHHDTQTLALEKSAMQQESISLSNLHKVAKDTTLAAALADLKPAYDAGVKGDALAYKAMRLTKDQTARADLATAIYDYSTSNYYMERLLKAKTLKAVQQRLPTIISIIRGANGSLRMAIRESGK